MQEDVCTRDKCIFPSLLFYNSISLSFFHNPSHFCYTFYVVQGEKWKEQQKKKKRWKLKNHSCVAFSEYKWGMLSKSFGSYRKEKSGKSVEEM